MAEKKHTNKILAQNKKAYFDYFVEEEYEAGIELVGTEVKSIRMGKVNLKDSYCGIEKLELFVYGMHVSPYEKGNIFNKDPLRDRRLLMHKKEVLALYNKQKKDGYTIIPLSLYLKGPVVKIKIGLCKGKKNYDKRESIAKRDSQREAMRNEEQ